MRGRAAFAYRASSVDTIACRASVDSTLLPAVMDQIFVDNRDFYRATRMHSADYAVARCPSVRLSARLSHAGIESKWLHVFFHRRVAPPF